MKSTEIQNIKQLSQATVDMIPAGVSVDGFNNFYFGLDKIDVIDLLRQIEEASKKAVELNLAVHRIEERKSPKNNNNKYPPPPDPEPDHIKESKPIKPSPQNNQQPGKTTINK